MLPWLLPRLWLTKLSWRSWTSMVGCRSASALASWPCTVLPDLPFFPGLGNALGEEGCEQLQEVLDSFNMAKVLASLR